MAGVDLGLLVGTAFFSMHAIFQKPTGWSRSYVVPASVAAIADFDP
jgi:hypothetical protein